MIDAYAAYYVSGFEALAERTGVTPLGVLDAYFDWLAEEVEAAFPHGGCLYGMLAQTIAMRSPELREKLLVVFRGWEERLSKVLEDARRMGEIPHETNIGEAVSLLIDAYEGAIVRMKAEGSTAAFTRFRKRVPRLLRAAA